MMAPDQPVPTRELHYVIRWLTPGFKQLPPTTSEILAGVPCVVEGERLVARPVDPEATIEALRAELEPALAAWSLELEVTCGWRILFERAGFAWDDPDQPGQPKHFRREVADHATVTDSASVMAEAPLPSPTGNYRMTTSTTIYLERLRDVKEGRSPVPAAVNSLLTRLKHDFGQDNKEQMRQVLGLSRRLTSRIGEVAVWKHDRVERKHLASKPELTPQNLAWLGTVMTALVHRAIAVESGITDLPELDLSDFPGAPRQR